jgi:hypothetical protein
MSSRMIRSIFGIIIKDISILLLILLDRLVIDLMVKRLLIIITMITIEFTLSLYS